VQQREDFFGRHEAVGDHADEERRDDRRYRRRAGGKADLLARVVLTEPPVDAWWT